MKKTIGKTIPVVNLEQGLPNLDQAIRRLKSVIDTNNHLGQNKERIIKIIHGYGSSEAGGGVLKSGLQNYLKEILRSHSINGFIRGEDFGKHTITGKNLAKEFPHVASDRDFGRGNIGITIIVFNK